MINVLLETIACALTRRRSLLPHFLPAFIELLKQPITVAHSEERGLVEAILSRFIVRLIELIAAADDNDENTIPGMGGFSVKIKYKV